MKKILITGISGFVGGYFVDYLTIPWRSTRDPWYQPFETCMEFCTCNN